MSTLREPAHPQHSMSPPSSHLDQGTKPYHSCLHPRSASPTEHVQIPEKVSRKVSFSDVVVTSSRVENTEREAVAAARFYEQVNVEERRSSSPVGEAGHNIDVQLIDAKEHELTRDTALAASTLPVYEVKLGMLKQATIYHVEFVVPDALPLRAAELLRYIDEVPGHVNAPVNVGANVELLECDVEASVGGHRLLLKLSTTKQRQVNEFFTLRLIDNPKEAVHLVLHGLSLARGQGTPFLRLGIHRIGENPDYEDSDEFTEWPGFPVPLEEEEAEGDDAPDPLEPDQGDRPEDTEDPFIT
ncbi:hypothetical protein X801_10309 [Opisthorchis viverrini]|uniref:Uncharacterized protein n=2 Tax=Opisthorchis viverrini TaxID=6198 RepID=A0A1S8WHK2_OPIVI|nr:hypothetical protein T265_09884 [Opisthorchis viverrini]KER21903.1 hypothetical protein T265_09884 [Opisthorchis viverrini]OON13907.1 hypothetical protein X801_10309 [Opisthorchis viverrini]